MASKASRPNGSVADAASVPNRQAEIMLLFLVARLSMSKAIMRLAATPAASTTTFGSVVASPGFSFSAVRIQTVGRGDQRRAVGRHQSAQNGAAGFDQFGGKHDVDFARRRHQREDRRAAGFRRQHLDVVDRGAGALRDAGHRGRLRVPALRLGKFHDPVGEHAAALSAHRHDGDRRSAAAREPHRRLVAAFRRDRSSARTSASVREHNAPGFAAALQEADHRAAQPGHEAIEPASDCE